MVGLAIDNLAALPTDWAHEYFGMAAPPSVAARAWLIMSLAELGRFAEATRYEAEAIRLAKQRSMRTRCSANFGASMLHLVKGDSATALSRVKHWIAMLRTGMSPSNFLGRSPPARGPWRRSARSEARDRVREGEQLLEHQMARGIVGHRSWAYGAVGRACLLLGQLDEARRLGDRRLKSAWRQPGFTAHALYLLGDIATHPDRFDSEKRGSPLSGGAGSRQLHRMRPLVAHCRLGLGKLYRHIGETEHARDNLAVATTMYREMDMGIWLEQGRQYDELQ